MEQGSTIRAGSYQDTQNDTSPQKTHDEILDVYCSWLVSIAEMSRKSRKGTAVSVKDSLTGFALFIWSYSAYVIPAKAGIHPSGAPSNNEAQEQTLGWIPAFAGMT